MKRHLLYAIMLGVLLGACSTPKNITYLQGFENGQSQAVMLPKRLTAQADDRLSIVVSSQDPALAEVFNLMVAQQRIGLSSTKMTSTNDSKVATFTVNPDGDIDYPLLGKISVAGLSRSEIAEKIKKEIISSGLLKDPIVTVDFLNATVTVLGDVARPGEYAISRDDMTLLQAISEAGDLNITGRRDNVLVIRREGDNEVAYRVDLTSPESVMQSPVYYVQQNDAIYVEPNKKKKREANANGNTALTSSFWISVVSVMTTIAVLIFK